MGAFRQLSAPECDFVYFLIAVIVIEPCGHGLARQVCLGVPSG
jgi:hypothetical protein